MTQLAALPAVTDLTFAREVLQHDLPVLVDFWAQWCPPCHLIKPVLAAIAAERAGSLAVCTVNADENPLSARAYRVLSLPTLILFRAGQSVLMVVGARPRSRLLSEVDGALIR